MHVPAVVPTLVCIRGVRFYLNTWGAAFCSQVITQLKTLSAQNKQASSAALKGSRIAGGSHRRSASEGSGCVGGRGIDGGGGGGGVSAGRKHAVSSLMTLAQLQYKRAAVSKVGGRFPSVVRKQECSKE